MDKIILACWDRDGPINVDEDDGFLGKDSNWRNKVELMPGIIEAMQKLQKQFPKLQHHIVTNQGGVAINSPGFEELTEQRVAEVNQEIIRRLNNEGIIIHSCQVCPYVDKEYVEQSKKKNRSIDPKYIKDNPPNRKPSSGMIFDIIKSRNLSVHNCCVIMFGDRLTDVETGVNAGGYGILIPSQKTHERGDIEKLAQRRKENSNFASKTLFAKDAKTAADEAIKLLSIFS
jgi:histidinol-phosphate phosphatase family protein